jgi:hypothetical protein
LRAVGDLLDVGQAQVNGFDSVIFMRVIQTIRLLR